MTLTTTIASKALSFASHPAFIAVASILGAILLGYLIYSLISGKKAETPESKDNGPNSAALDAKSKVEPKPATELESQAAAALDDESKPEPASEPQATATAGATAGLPNPPTSDNTAASPVGETADTDSATTNNSGDEPEPDSGQPAVSSGRA